MDRGKRTEIIRGGNGGIMKRKRKQVYNPFLPLNEYIPDGEPHVFGGRIYLFGSHDRFGGDRYCMEDYAVSYTHLTLPTNSRV